jgi:hypothetical protein
MVENSSLLRCDAIVLDVSNDHCASTFNGQAVPRNTNCLTIQNWGTTITETTKLHIPEPESSVHIQSNLYTNKWYSRFLRNHKALRTSEYRSADSQMISAELCTTSSVSPKRRWVCRLCSQLVKATRDVVSTFPFVLFERPFSFQTITQYFPQPLLPTTKVCEPNPETVCSLNPDQ